MSKKRQFETCEMCGKVLMVYREGDPRGNYVMWTTDPFGEEIYGDETLHWLCDDCCHQQSMEI